MRSDGRFRTLERPVSGRADRWIRRTTIGCVGMLALIAGTVSYLHMHFAGAAERSAPVGGCADADPAAPDFFSDWDHADDDISAVLRSEAGANPHDKELIELIGELSTRSEEFRRRWAAHDVRFHRPGRRRLVHPVVGVLDLDFEAMVFPAHPGLTMLAYTTPAGTPTADSLRMLASLAITAEKAGRAAPSRLTPRLASSLKFSLVRGCQNFRTVAPP